MNRRLSAAMLLACLSILASPSLRSQAAPPAEEAPAATVSWQNDLDGPVTGQVHFAQTHVIEVPRRIFDPLLVPGREALVIFEPFPFLRLASATVVASAGGKQTSLSMAPPQALPGSAIFDQHNVFSGKPIIGAFASFSTNAYTAVLPPGLVQPDMQLRFVVNGDPHKYGTLDTRKLTFMENQSEGLVLMNIKGCLFRPQNTCRTTLDQYDMQKNPELAKIAAREMFSELPVRQLVLGMGESHWPYVIARGPDGRPHRYSTADRDYREWARFGDKTLPAKLGMGNFWRAASDLGYKQPGKFVAISGQLLDVPDDIPVLPPGVGASCGGNSCNYPSVPVGFWHETGHGLGLPHATPPRYEAWAWRGYDLRFLPNVHPNPSAYGLGKDHLGRHYFGHVLGTLTEPAWPSSTASAPLIDEFEQLRRESPGKITDWKHYLAPYTHQQMLQVQQRFGRFPDGLEYARLTDDYRNPPGPAPETTTPGPDSEADIDQGALPDVPDPLHIRTLIQPGQEPVQKGVPVHTLVITMADRSNDKEQVSQIYPAIVSNYGNVFAIPEASSPADSSLPSAISNARIQSLQTGKCLAVVNGTPILEACAPAQPRQQWTQVGKAQFRLRNTASLTCLDKSLRLVTCANQALQNWGLRRDLTGSDNILRLQNMSDGRFITAGPNDTVTVEGIRGDEQLFMSYDDAAVTNDFTLEVSYLDSSSSIWKLYPGAIAPDGLITMAINVPSRRNPMNAILRRNGEFVASRSLLFNSLPPAITVGGSKGYPAVVPQMLRSEETGQCLKRLPVIGIVQSSCNSNDESQWWGFVPVLSGQGRRLLVTGLTSATCLQAPLRARDCESSLPEYQWGLREDLAPAGTLMLQNMHDGTFVTASSDQTSVSLQALSHVANQYWRRVTVK